MSNEPLWAIPVPIQERLRQRDRDREYQHFLLCGLYSAVALTFLLLFGFAALGRGEQAYAMVIFGFAAATALVYGSAWYSQHYGYVRHFLTALMGLLCLYLFYTGGTANSGPLYYFVFPLVAVFLQGLRLGIAAVVILGVCTLLLIAGAFGFDQTRYESIFVIRVLAVYMIIAMLAFLFEYFRVKAERELMLSLYDLNQMTFGDLMTSLANRRLMEKLLVSEFNRVSRYGVESCILMLEPDIDPYFRGEQLQQVRTMLATEFRRHLRLQDIPGCWDESSFLILLPETGLEGASALARRLVQECGRHSITVAGQRERKLSVSISVASIQGEGPDSPVALATRLLDQARREGGNRIKRGDEDLARQS